MTLWTVENITYNRQTIERGVVLARRKYKSELARTQQPCQLFDGGLRISFNTPHRRDLAVFVPISELAPGKVLTWLRYDPDTRKTFESEILIAEVSSHHVSFETLKEDERFFQKRSTKQFIKSISAHSFGMVNNPFMTGISGQAHPLPPAVIYWQDRAFVQRTRFCFVWQPERRKRTGTPYKQVCPEEITGEVFRYDFEPFDLLTGRKLDAFMPDLRAEHFGRGLKPSPTWKEV